MDDDAELCEEMRCLRLFREADCAGDDCAHIDRKLGIQIFFAPEGSDDSFLVAVMDKEIRQ